MSITLALVALFFALASLVISVRANRKANLAKHNTLALNKRQLKLRTELKQSYSSLTGMGQRILQTENQLNLLEDKYAHKDFYDKREANYRQADKMLELGGKEEDIAECGLSTAEARLMKILKTK